MPTFVPQDYGPYNTAFNWAFSHALGALGPEVRCSPAYEYAPGVHWIYGGGLPGVSIDYIDRVHEYDQTRHRVTGSTNLSISNARTYDEFHTRNAANSADLTPATYDQILIEYNLYCDALSGYGGSFALLDAEVPVDQPFHYEVHTNDCKADDLIVVSGQCTHPVQDEFKDTDLCSPVLLTDPLVVGLGQWLGLLKIDPLSYPGRIDLVDVIAQAAPVAISDVRSAARTTMYFMTRTLEQRALMLKMLETGRVLFLRNPDHRYPENNWYLAVGNLTEERILSDHTRPERRWVVEVAVIERPVGYLDTGAGRNYATVRDYYPDGNPVLPGDPWNYNTLVVSAYTTYMGVLLGNYPGFIPGAPMPTVPFSSSWEILDA